MLRHLLQLFLDLHPSELPPVPPPRLQRIPGDPDPRATLPATGAPSTWARVGPPPRPPGRAPPGQPPRPAEASPPPALFRPVRVQRPRTPPPPEPEARAFGTCGGRTAPLAIDLEARTLPLCDTRPRCARWQDQGPPACHGCTDWQQ